MPVYAALPISAVDDLQLRYKPADPTTWTISRATADGQIKHFGGIEERNISDAQRAEILSLGGIIFENDKQFIKWLHKHDEAIPTLET